MMAGKVVLIEGVDGSGKTTLVRNLTEELTRRGSSVRVSRNALCPDNPIALVADRLRRDPEAGLQETGHLFLASHLWDARNFQPPQPGTLHIQDSSWLRTLAYHTMNQTPIVPEVLRKISKSFPCFDQVIYLTADFETRARRLDLREREQSGSNDAGDREISSNRRFTQRLDEMLLKFVNKCTKDPEIIDTSRLSGTEVFQHAWELMQRPTDGV